MFHNRIDAGRVLAKQLQTMGTFQDAIVLALPRGGVPLAYEVARILHLPLDVIIVRKLGAPLNPELAIGALVEGTPNRVVWNETIIAQLHVGKEYLNEIVAKESQELYRRKERYRAGRELLKSLSGKDIILVDDGIATGYTIKAALIEIREQHPASITVAVAVAPQGSLEEMKRLADQVLILETPTPFWSVGASYENFDQTSDEEVVELLDKAKEPF